MIITIGKHKGKSVSEVVLKHPQYVKWVLEQTDATGQLKTIQKEMFRLIEIFNSKPFAKKCYGNNCNNSATRCSAYADNFQSLYWWCNNCNPYQSGANEGKLYSISTYQNALAYVQIVHNNSITVSSALIKRLAQEKGLPTRVKKGDIEKFFLEL